MMTSTISHPSTVPPRSSRRAVGSSRRADRPYPRRERGSRSERRVLGRYLDSQGCLREVLARPGLAGSVLVVDRDATTLGDRRLVAHLGADEPPENAALVCGSYLQEPRGQRCRCRPVTPEDSQTVPFPDDGDFESDARTVFSDAELLDSLGRSHRIERRETGLSIPELRWVQRLPRRGDRQPQSVSMREAISSLASYEPVRALTQQALATHRGDRDVSTAVLRVELARVQESPIVLNRKLREVVLATLDRQGVSMSEIAIRCGRIKLDCRGNESGETSWLARRLGLLPEGGKDTPTPWIHSDVLALIARRGLGISPREVESE
jgi:hypothetical protein